VVPAPYPRGDAFRTSAEYAAQCHVVSNALHAAMGEAA
jgi:NitT/TauT family transport system ATP-binding protein